jgi:RNA polymerase sigma factor (sigma-70 family)
MQIFTISDERVLTICEMSETTTGKDQQWLERLQSGDQEVLVLLYKNNHTMIRSYVLKNQGRNEDAEDLLQDALIVLWQKAQQGNFVLSSKLSTYIMAVCKNLWLKRLGKQQRLEGEDKILPHLHVTADNFSEISDFKHLQKAMDEIGETCKKLLMMFYFDGNDMEQIARKMQFANADTAKAKKYQCFKKLETLIKSRFNKSDFMG